MEEQDSVRASTHVMSGVGSYVTLYGGGGWKKESWWEAKESGDRGSES